MPGMDEFICVPTETIPMPKKHEHQWEGHDRAYCEICGSQNEEFIAQKSINFPWDKNLDDFRTLVNNLRNEKEYSRADVVEYLIERCRRLENI